MLFGYRAVSHIIGSLQSYACLLGGCELQSDSMEARMDSSLSNEETRNRPPDHVGILSRFWWTPRWAYILSIAMMMIFFVADVILPRGATVAIGYCLVPAIAAGTRRLDFLFGMTITCTALTWTAFFVEPAGYAAWQSAFDRLMVTGVVWFALLLVLRRAAVIRKLIHQRQALKDTTLELERSNGELSSFASVVAHDLRGPLNTVGLFSQLLSSSNSIKADAECVESLGSIQAEITRMSGFIHSLLSYGRVGSGDLKLQACDCESVLKDVQRNLTADLERSSVEISNDPLPVVWADTMLIVQLLQNLIENSIKYRSEAIPRIHITAAQRSDGWLFSLRDNGVGIRPEDCERIFKPFCQTDAGKSLGNGVGLGLATCKRIVERHGGHIRAQSRPGEGTTFLFTIPGDSVAPIPATPLAMTQTRPSVPQVGAMK